MPKYIIEIPLPNSKGISIYMLRLDLMQPQIQGNKYYKLKYNIDFALNNKLSILTVGGAHSNHLHATALACKNQNIACYGIIRGTNYSELTPTLRFCQENGMKLLFVETEAYRQIRNAKNNEEIILILEKEKQEIPNDFHFVAEGGSNTLGIQGATEILDELDISAFDIIVCPVGSGGTLSGIILGLNGNKEVLGISALKDAYLVQSIDDFTNNAYTNWSINFDYHFGGFAKWKPELINFINKFKEKYAIPLCPIYTGKMMYALFDLIITDKIPKNYKILCIHTGGLQGIDGFNNANNNLLH